MRAFGRAKAFSGSVEPDPVRLRFEGWRDGLPTYLPTYLLQKEKTGPTAWFHAETSELDLRGTRCAGTHDSHTSERRGSKRYFREQ